MNIHSTIHDYNLQVEKDFDFVEALITKPNTFIVVDNNVYELYKSLFISAPSERILLFDAKEENKTIDSALLICKAMTAISAKRNASLVSFGGGITQDVTGFAANILYRGIHWTFVPTTLLSACDSCIGGKTSINYEGFKNLLGTFFPPEEIHVCTRFFKTLTNADYMSGLGEVYKFNILQGFEAISDLEQESGALLVRDENTVARFTLSSLEFKKTFIEKDEFDRGVRVYLNFGHTFGHAFESLSQFSIPHGTAVAIGIMVANRISLNRGLMDTTGVGRIEALLERIIPVCDLTQWSEVEIIKAIRKDKKQIDGGITAVLIDYNAKPCLVNDLQPDEILSAVRIVSTILLNGTKE